MGLHFRKLGQGQPLIILHGLYGSSDNWYSIAKVFSAYFTVYTIDLRNHGHSAHYPTHTYNDMAADIVNFCQEHNIEKATFAGHSMGGKTAMLLALEHPQLIEKLIVVDIAPKAYSLLLEPSEHVLQHINIMQAFANVDLTGLTKREEVDMLLAEYIADPPTRQFLMKNLVRKESGFQWQLNTKVLRNSLPEIINGPDFNKILFDKSQITYPVLFVKGEKSGYIKDEDMITIRKIFPKAELSVIFNAGHWLHAEQPQSFINTLKYFLCL
ncbi:MAG TPA: alpha/beta fold hydrolase [Bacteroidales bacterium]|nr:alpha/beta fold hydrolase [Bacteroidales bacterium]